MGRLSSAPTGHALGDRSREKGFPHQSPRMPARTASPERVVGIRPIRCRTRCPSRQGEGVHVPPPRSREGGSRAYRSSMMAAYGIAMRPIYCTCNVSCPNIVSGGSAATLHPRTRGGCDHVALASPPAGTAVPAGACPSVSGECVPDRMGHSLQAAGHGRSLRSATPRYRPRREPLMPGTTHEAFRRR